MNKRCAIQIENLWTRFDDDFGGSKLIHKNINLSINNGEIVGLVGASGCGKTTLLREIIGLQSPSEGKITIMGQRLDESLVKNPKNTALRCGVLFQKGALFSAMDVLTTSPSRYGNWVLPMKILSSA